MKKNKYILNKIAKQISESNTQKNILKINAQNNTSFLIEIEKKSANTFNPIIYLNLDYYPNIKDESSIKIFFELNISYQLLDYISKYHKTIFEEYFITEKLKIKYLLELYYEEINKRGRSILGLEIGDILFPILEKIKNESNLDEITILMDHFNYQDFITQKTLELYFKYFKKVVLVYNSKEYKKLKRVR